MITIKTEKNIIIIKKKNVLYFNQIIKKKKLKFYTPVNECRL